MFKAKKEKWLMSSFTFGVPVEVEKDKGIIRQAAVVTAGIAKGHGVYCDDYFLDKVVAFGNEKTRGLKVRFGHPNMSSSALGTFIGRAKNFRLDGDRVRADIFLSNAAKEAPCGNLYDYIMELSKKEPDMFGMSIVFKPGKRYQRDEDNNMVEVYDEEEPVFTDIEGLMGVDFVDSPAANPAGLFDSGTLAGQVTEFLDIHPELFEAVVKDHSIIDSFLSKYSDYLTAQNKTGKDIAKEVKKIEDSIHNNTEMNENIDSKKEVVTNLPTTDIEFDQVLDFEKSEMLNMFKEMANKDGYEFAKENFGKSDVELLAIKNELLQQENVLLKEQQAYQKNITAEPITFSEDDQIKDIVQIVTAKKASGLSAQQAWTETINENPVEYQKYINKQ